MTSWLCESLGLPMLQEDEPDGFELNGPARAVLGEAKCHDLATCVLRLGGGVALGDLEQAIERARQGERQRLTSALGQQVLIACDPQGRLSVVVAPRPQSASADITAGVSHELANALNAIAGWARLAQQGERVSEALELIQHSAESAWSAARKVLGHLKDGEQQEEVVDLAAFVDEATRLLRPKAMAKGVHVETQLTPDLKVAADRGSLWSIVWNLAVNAVEALPAGGRLELRVGQGQGGSAVLVVQDDGPGMSAAQRDRAFEPYFSTKESGTGLGLAMVKQAVAELGGEITLESEPGRGTVFQVALPLARGSSRRPNSKRSSGVFYAEPLEQRVLVVDDDANLREMIATALSMRGAEVVCAANSKSALAQSGPFAMAVVDFLLPDIRGDELLARLRGSGIVSTGVLVTGTELPDQLAAGGTPDAVMRKPFELEDLFERLAELLSRNRDSSATG